MDEWIKKIFIFLLLSCNPIMGQQDDIDFYIQHFDVTADNEILLFRYTLNAGAVCSDLSIEKSTDGNDFKEVFKHFGVCGSTFRDETYHWVDENPLQGRSYYRLNIYGYIYSDTLTLDFTKIGKEGVLAYPNPTKHFIHLKLENTRKETFQLSIFDLSGNKKMVQSFSTDFITIPLENWSNGTYFYRIENMNFQYEGRFLILK